MVPRRWVRLAVATVAAWVVQTSIHMALPETNVTVGVRFSFYTVQALAMIAMMVLIALAAIAHRTG